MRLFDYTCSRLAQDLLKTCSRLAQYLLKTLKNPHGFKITSFFQKLRFHQVWVVISFCTCSFVLSLPFCTPMTGEMVTMLDNALASTTLVCGLTEVILICWVYGMDKFLKCLKEMEIKISTATEWYLVIYR